MRDGILNGVLRPELSFVCEKHLKDLNSDRCNSRAKKELLWLIPVPTKRNLITCENFPLISFL